MLLRGSESAARMLKFGPSEVPRENMCSVLFVHVGLPNPPRLELDILYNQPETYKCCYVLHLLSFIFAGQKQRSLVWVVTLCTDLCADLCNVRLCYDLFIMPSYVFSCYKCHPATWW